jgi:mannosyltransferase OCH1-like enzyme
MAVPPRGEAARSFTSSFIPHPSSFSARFPRLIHQIWLGPNPLPENFKAWSEGWRRQHPGWHHQLWRDADAVAFPMVNRAAFESAENFAMKADIFRYELLLRHGGLYADLDFECLRPLDPLLEQVGEEAFGGFEWPTVNHCESLCNALLGALPGSPFFRHVVAALPENIRLHAAEREVHGVEFISRATGPAFLTRMAAAFPRITAFPQPVPYPRASQKPAAYAQHHFAGSWRGEWDRQSAPAAY